MRSRKRERGQSCGLAWLWKSHNQKNKKVHDVAIIFKERFDEQTRLVHISAHRLRGVVEITLAFWFKEHAGRSISIKKKFVSLPESSRLSRIPDQMKSLWKICYQCGVGLLGCARASTRSNRTVLRCSDVKSEGIAVKREEHFVIICRMIM